MKKKLKIVEDTIEPTNTAMYVWVNEKIGLVKIITDENVKEPILIMPVRRKP